MRRKTRIPAASAVRLALSAALGFFSLPSGSPRKMVEPAIPPSSTICAFDSVLVLRCKAYLTKREDYSR
jgi:hypothetical protein